MKDLVNHLAVAQTLLPALRTATTNGAGVNLAGFESAMFSFDMGIFTGTSPAATVEYQESSDNSVFTAIAGADLDSGAQPVQITTANDNAVIKDGYKGSKQYLRVAITAISGTSASLPCSGSIIKGNGRHQPV